MRSGCRLFLHLTTLIGKLEGQDVGMFDLGELVEQFGTMRDQAAPDLASEMREPTCIAGKCIEDGKLVFAEANGVPCARVGLLQHGRQAVTKEVLELSGFAWLGSQAHKQCFAYVRARLIGNRWGLSVACFSWSLSLRSAEWIRTMSTK